MSGGLQLAGKMLSGIPDKIFFCLPNGKRSAKISHLKRIINFKLIYYVTSISRLPPLDQLPVPIPFPKLGKLWLKKRLFAGEFSVLGGYGGGCVKMWIIIQRVRIE